MEYAQDRNLPESVRGSETLFAPLREHLRLLDEFLDAQIPCFEPSVRPLVADTFQHRGKRLRPALVFYAGWTGETPPEALVRAAAVVELVHLATLVHDDILDDAVIRHSSPTSVARHGGHTAVLLGDALFAHALALAADFPTTDVCRIISLATRQVCSGEICQTFERGNPRISLEQYFRIIQLKTAELFEASCRLGAFLAFPKTTKPSAEADDADANYVEACARYGRHLGRAYQIFDDIVDITGTEIGAGKTLHTDFASGKFTLPVLLYLRQLAPNASDALAVALNRREIAPDVLAEKMFSAGIPTQCHEIFAEEVRLALAAIAPFSGKFGHPHLNTFATFVSRQLGAKLFA